MSLRKDSMLALVDSGQVGVVLRALVEQMPDDAAQPAAGIDVSELVERLRERIKLHQQRQDEHSKAATGAICFAIDSVRAWAAKQPAPAFDRGAVAEAILADVRNWWVNCEIAPKQVTHDDRLALDEIIRRHLIPNYADSPSDEHPVVEAKQPVAALNREAVTEALIAELKTIWFNTGLSWVDVTALIRRHLLPAEGGTNP